MGKGRRKQKAASRNKGREKVEISRQRKVGIGTSRDHTRRTAPYSAVPSSPGRGGEPLSQPF